MNQADLMPFSEIGKQLGMSEKMALYYYNRAIEKLLRKPGALKVLADLSTERQRLRRGIANV
jgi:hypothetical protein